jgi:CRISPR-associated endonuclease Csn1
MSKRSQDYNIGLDIGTNSVGWAVTDEHYNLLNIKKTNLWGARLFKQA